MKKALKKIKKALKNKKTLKWTQQDQKMLDFYSQFISNNDVVFDVGANIGNRSKIFLKLNASVIAVEPQDECIKYLQSTFGNNKNIKIVLKVLGPSIGET